MHLTSTYLIQLDSQCVQRLLNDAVCVTQLTLTDELLLLRAVRARLPSARHSRRGRMEMSVCCNRLLESSRRPSLPSLSPSPSSLGQALALALYLSLSQDLPANVTD